MPTRTTLSPSTDGDPARSPLFASFAALQKQHIEFTRQRAKDVPSPAFLAEVESFLAQAQATGRVIQDDDERIAAQSIIDYWITVLLRARRIPPEIELADFTAPTNWESLRQVPAPPDPAAERAAVRRRLRLSAAAAQWADSGKDSALLWGGEQLDQASKHTDLSDIEKTFLRRSMEHEKRSRRIKWWVTRILVTLALSILGLIAWSAHNRRRASDAALELFRAQARITQNNLDIRELELEASKKEKANAERLAKVELEASRQEKANAEQIAKVQTLELEASRREKASAEQLAKVEAAKSESERKLRHESYHQLATYWVDRAALSMHEGDVAGALLWFIGALKKDLAAEKKDAEALHRLRLGATLAQLPRLDRVIADDPQVRIDAAQISPDGARVLTAANQLDETAGVVRIWDAATGEKLHTLDHPKGRVNWAAFSAGGSVIVASGASGSGRGVARLWDRDGRESEVFKDIQSPVLHAAFAPDGQRVALVRETKDRACTVEVREITGELAFAVGWGGEIAQVAFSPAPESEQGLYLLAAGSSKGRGAFKVWDAWTGSAISGTDEPTLQDLPVHTAAFSPDNRFLVTGSGEGPDAERGEIQVWETFTGIRRFVAGHRGLVAAVAFSPDGRRVASAGYDGKARLWDAANGRRIFDLSHESSLYHAAFSPDGRFLITASRDRTARIWNTATGLLERPPLHHESTVLIAGFAEDGQRVLTSTRGIVRLWQMATGEPATPVFKLENRVLRAALSADGQRVAAVSVAGEIGVGSTSRGQWSVQKAARPDNAFFSPDAQFVLLAGKDRAEIRSTALTPSPRPMAGWRGTVRYAAFSADGKKALLFQQEPAQKEGTALLWDVTGGRALGKALAVVGDVAYAVFDPSGGYVLTAGGTGSPQRGEARVWHVATGEPASPPLAHLEKVVHASFDRTLSRVITASVDDSARIWSLELAPHSPGQARPLHHLKGGHTADVTRATFSEDGALALTASYDRTAIVWDVETGQTRVILEHPGAINDANFDRQRRFVVTAGSDRTARVWDVATGDFVTLFQHAGEVAQAIFVEDDKLLTLCPDEPVRVRGESWRETPAGQDADPIRLPQETMPRTRQWRLPVATGSPDKLEALAELFRAKQFEERPRNPVRVKRGEVGAIWSSVAQDYAALFPPAAAQSYAAEESEAAGQWFAAVWHLERRLRDAPGQAELLEQKARALKQLGRGKEAIADYSAALRSKPNDPTILAAIAALHAERGQWTEAVRFASQAITSPSSAPDVEARVEAFMLRASDFAARNKWTEAAADLRKAWELKPDYVRAGVRLAAVQLKLPSPAGYQAVCRKLLLDHASDEEAADTAWACVLGPNAVPEEEHPRLIDLARRASSSARYQNLNTVGAVLFRTGDLQTAWRTLEEAREAYARESGLIHRDTGRIVDWLFLSMAHATLGDLRAAREAFNHVQPFDDWKSLSDKRKGWQNFLLRILRDEAEKMLGPEKTPGARKGNPP